MSLKSNVILNIYSIMIIIIIYFQALRCLEKEYLRDKLYMSMLNITVFMLVIDILSRFDGKSVALYPVLNNIGNFLIFLANPILPSIWVVYVYLQIFHEEKKIGRLVYLLCAINAINITLLIFSQFFDLFYYIDSNNIYHRGSYFALPVLIDFILLSIAFAIISLNRRRLDKKSFLSLMFFALPPIVSIFLQIRFYGMSLMLNSIVLSLLVLFLNFQNHDMHTDHLTKINNRKKFDVYLKKKINTSTAGNAFSAILADINNFKQINDTYGHSIGDEALETTAKLLKDCLRVNDFIARLGGDEFCLILDISDKNELESVVCRINKCLENYNQCDSHPYSLELSMGYAVYNAQLHKNAENFLKQIDLLMYQEKRSSKGKTY